MIDLGPVWTLVVVFGALAVIPALGVFSALITRVKRWWYESITAMLLRSRLRRYRKPTAARRCRQPRRAAAHHWWRRR